MGLGRSIKAWFEGGEKVEVLVKKYLAEKGGRVKDSSYKVLKSVLSGISKEFGHRRASTIRGRDIETWLANPNWSPSTQNTKGQAMRNLLAWGKRKGYLKDVPEFTIPRAVPREGDFDQQLVDKILKAADPEFRDYLFCLDRIGCRPGELAGLEAKHIRWGQHCAILDDHKTARYGYKRVLYFDAQAEAILLKLSEKHPTGPLFLATCQRKKRPFDARLRSKKFKQIREKLGLPDTAVPHLFRHTFITRALLNGVPPAKVAALVGHGSTKMIYKVYSHLTDHSSQMHEAVQAANQRLTCASSMAEDSASLTDCPSPKNSPPPTDRETSAQP